MNLRSKGHHTLIIIGLKVLQINKVHYNKKLRTYKFTNASDKAWSWTTRRAEVYIAYPSE